MDWRLALTIAVIAFVAGLIWGDVKRDWKRRKPRRRWEGD